MRRALIIFELTEEKGNDWMVGDLRRGLKRCGVQVAHFHGCFTRVSHGGLRPKRLVNALYMLLLLPFVLFASRKMDCVIVRSTPPLLHLPAVWICRLLKLPCVLWLMDYHPVIEKRVWQQRKWLQPLLKGLDAWDRRSLKYFRSVLTPDPAMHDLVREREPDVPIWVHPTWGSRETCNVTGAERTLESVNQVERTTLAYLGNFGRGHVWKLMVRVVEALSARKPVHIIGIGLPEAVEQDFLALTELDGVTVDTHKRLPLEEIRELFISEQVDYGCVAVREALQGCLSPSKFSTYLDLDVPILYIGPEGTNAWKVCAEFGGGVCLTGEPAPEAFTETVDHIVSKRGSSELQEGVAAAKAYFNSFDGDSLARAIIQAVK